MKLDLNKNKKYLLACSYGPDSMCLFDLLIKNGYKFSVANVNYNLRKESKKESDDLKNVCEAYNIEFFHLNVEEKITKNIEEKCREIRFDFFKKIYDSNGFDALLIAHNEDDYFETYFLQKRRRGIVEYYGLNFSSNFKGMNVIRPLLDYSKESLKKYNETYDIPYCIDQSNYDTKFERNKIRHDIVSKLSDEERIKLKSKILKLNIKNLENHNEILRNATNIIEGTNKLSDKDFAYLFVCFCRQHFEGIDFSMNRIKEIRKILNSNKPNIINKLKGNLYIIKSYNKFYIKMLKKDANFYYVLEEPSILDTEYLYLNFLNSSKNRNVSKEDYPLTVRNANKNDEYFVKGYRCSMRRQFINWKMPLDLRERWPIIENKNHEIIYVPRYDPNFKITDDLNFYVKI